MPVITVVGSKVTEEVKNALIEQLTSVASSVMGTPKQFFTVVIDEKPDTNIGLGGESVADLKARLKKQAESAGE